MNGNLLARRKRPVRHERSRPIHPAILLLMLLATACSSTARTDGLAERSDATLAFKEEMQSVSASQKAHYLLGCLSQADIAYLASLEDADAMPYHAQFWERRFGELGKTVTLAEYYAPPSLEDPVLRAASCADIRWSTLTTEALDDLGFIFLLELDLLDDAATSSGLSWDERHALGQCLLSLGRQAAQAASSSRDRNEHLAAIGLEMISRYYAILHSSATEAELADIGYSREYIEKSLAPVGLLDRLEYWRQ